MVFDLEYKNKVDFSYSNLRENLQLVLFSAVGFLLPFFLSHPQILVGSVVNMMLVLGAQNIKGNKLWALILMPSLGVLVSGMLFGSLTKFLLFFIPMIWVSNAVLVFGYKFFRAKSGHQVISLLKVIGLKVGLLSVYAFVLVSLGVVPQVFLVAMSVLQLVTALIGGFSALGISYFILKKFV